MSDESLPPPDLAVRVDVSRTGVVKIANRLGTDVPTLLRAIASAYEADEAEGVVLDFPVRPRG